MKVYTKSGDKGETALFGGRKVSKADLRIESYGNLDELNAWIGALASSKPLEEEKETLLRIQDYLFVLGSHLASDPDKPKSTHIPAIETGKEIELEQSIDKMDASLAPMKHFILPSGSESAANCHIARTVCRRSERSIVALNNESRVDSEILKYINRLSDYLFVLARYCLLVQKLDEVPWKPNKND